MILIFLGAPGAGKGTQSNLIAKYFDIPHLSTGEILRNKLLEKDQISKELKKIIDSGELVSDEILNEIVSFRIDKKDCLKGFVLDGYPRTINQAIFLDSKLKLKNLNINKVLEIDIEEEVIVKRLKSRLNIEKRQDDSEEVIQKRISTYILETKPLSNFYKNHFFSDYVLIDGNQEIEKINEDIVKILKK